MLCNDITFYSAICNNATKHDNSGYINTNETRHEHKHECFEKPLVVQGIAFCSSNSEHQPFFQELVLLQFRHVPSQKNEST